jgi:hypothetical protein
MAHHKPPDHKLDIEGAGLSRAGSIPGAAPRSGAGRRWAIPVSSQLAGRRQEAPRGGDPSPPRGPPGTPKRFASSVRGDRPIRFRLSKKAERLSWKRPPARVSEWKRIDRAVFRTSDPPRSDRTGVRTRCPGLRPAFRHARASLRPDGRTGFHHASGEPDGFRLPAGHDTFIDPRGRSWRLLGMVRRPSARTGPRDFRSLPNPKPGSIRA